MKSRCERKRLTKNNLLLWSIFAFLPVLIGFIVIASSSIVFLILAEQESLDINSFLFAVFMAFLTAAATSFAATVVVYIQRLPGIWLLHKEEMYLNIKINQTLGNISIPKTDRLYLSDKWFVLTMRGHKGYVFHIDFIVGMDKFKRSTNNYENGYQGTLLTADGKAWKVFWDDSEYEIFRDWFKRKGL